METTPEQPAVRPQSSNLQQSQQSPGRRPSAPGSSAANVTSFSRNQAGYRVSDGINPQFPGLTRPRTRSVAKLEELEKQQPKDTMPPAKSFLEKYLADRAENTPPAPATWQPSKAIGSPLCLEHEDPTPIEFADRNIAQKRLMVAAYGATPAFTRMLDKAIRERAELDENDVENTMPYSTRPSLHRAIIAQRVELLRFVLRDSTFPPERQNISAAIDGYTSGAIPFSTTDYTIIWAGHIVDRCPSYDSFTHDRASRLDAYHAAHGPGWLWYEPPLTTSLVPAIRAKKGICLPNLNRAGTEGMGHYTVRMSFRRRRALNTRPLHPSTPAEIKNNITTYPAPASEPRVFYDMLLDCGATFPCIYESDLHTLNINPDTYAAVTARCLATAEVTLMRKTYELDVGVHEADDSTLVTADPPVWPAEQDVLGGVVTVVTLEGSPPSEDAPKKGAGERVPDRLSGILPFHVAYLSSAPGNYQIWLGEDRREVLGASRLPGQRRVAAFKEDYAGAERPWPRPALPFPLKTGPPREIDELGLGTPDRVVFEHKLPGAAGVVRDRDAGGGRSVITIGPRGATGPQREVHRVEPRKLPVQQAALLKRKQQPPVVSESEAALNKRKRQPSLVSPSEAALKKRKRQPSVVSPSEKSPTLGRNMKQRTK